MCWAAVFCAVPSRLFVCAGDVQHLPDRRHEHAALFVLSGILLWQNGPPACCTATGRRFCPSRCGVSAPGPCPRGCTCACMRCCCFFLVLITFLAFRVGPSTRCRGPASASVYVAAIAFATAGGLFDALLLCLVHALFGADPRARICFCSTEAGPSPRPMRRLLRRRRRHPHFPREHHAGVYELPAARVRGRKLPKEAPYLERSIRGLPRCNPYTAFSFHAG